MNYIGKKMKMPRIKLARGYNRRNKTYLTKDVEKVNPTKDPNYNFKVILNYIIYNPIIHTFLIVGFIAIMVKVLS